MLKFKFILLCYSIPAILWSQDSISPIHKTGYSKIFNQYLFPQPDQYGIIDSTDSWFSVFLDSMIQSPFDSSCLRCAAKTWHRNQEIQANAYLVINECKPYVWNIEDDTANWDTTLIHQSRSLHKTGLQLWSCVGEFFMNEDNDAEYSGRYSGAFQVYFLYDSLKNNILVCTNNLLPLDEPALLFYGYWKPLIHKELPNLPYFWASTKPSESEDSGYMLPDLRIQPDGSQSFTNRADFSLDCQKPSYMWYKTAKKMAIPGSN